MLLKSWICIFSVQVYEVVRPLLSLLHLDRSALQNFEALMALTNLASLSESLRYVPVKKGNKDFIFIRIKVKNKSYVYLKKNQFEL